jgi:hypothetical protein
LGKWLWHYAIKSEALWRLVIKTKYDSLRGGWCSKEVIGPFGVGVWKYIRSGWESFSKFVRFEVVDWSKISFWHNAWCGKQLLKIYYPGLFSIACWKDA